MMHTSVDKEIAALKEHSAYNAIMKAHAFLIENDQPQLAARWLDENIETIKAAK